MTDSIAPAEATLEVRLRVRLYIAARAPNSVAALAALRSALGAPYPSWAEVEVIDVLKDPERGLSDGVLVTPMLVRVYPLPERRILGNLSDRATLLHVVQLDEGSSLAETPSARAASS